MDLLNTKLVEKMQEYEKRFEDFPTFEFRAHSDAKVMEIIDECLEKNKDVYELGYLSLDYLY